MRKENKYHHFWRILFILFITYIAINVSVNNGYYESKLNNKTVLTKEAIMQFEQDIKEEKEIDINDYIINEYQDYSSPFSKLGVSVTKLFDKMANEYLENITNVFKKLFT